MQRGSCSQSLGSQRFHAKKKTKCYKERDEEARLAYLAKIAKIPERSIAYVDETGIDECLHRDMCRAKRGEKVYGLVSGRKYRRTNIVAGLLGGRVIAPMEYSGTTDHGVFESWFENALLAELPEGGVIVMDNASFHRKKPLLELARMASCEIFFLPPYSPDCNPIEKTWANMKRFLRNYSFKFDCIQNAITSYFKVE